jgi:hypothetical protein
VLGGGKEVIAVLKTMRERLVPVAVLGAWFVAAAYTMAVLSGLQITQLPVIAIPAMIITR